MPIYNYQARDKTGKIVRGKVEALSEREAASLVRDQSLFIIGLSVQHKTSFSFKGFHRISFTDIVGFTRQMATMITAGLQIQEALGLLIVQSTNPMFTEMMNKISREIQEGGNLATSLAKYPKYFSTTYVALIKAGETSGTIDQVMNRLADNLEKDQEFRARVKGAMIYPVIIMITMVLVVFILMTFVVPQLTTMFADFGADLPIQTRILQGISMVFAKFWWLMIIVGFIGSNLFIKWKSTYIGKHVWDNLMLRIPLLGELQKKIILVEFTRTLGMLVGAGVHILDSLNILVSAMRNIYYQEALQEITKKVEKGFPLGNLFAQYPIFPPIVAQMVKVGEETGKMDESLLKLSVYFERESDQTVKALTTAIEPLIMIVLAVGVGFIVFSIITPLYNLTTMIK